MWYLKKNAFAGISEIFSKFFLSMRIWADGSFRNWTDGFFRKSKWFFHFVFTLFFRLILWKFQNDPTRLFSFHFVFTLFSDWIFRKSKWFFFILFSFYFSDWIFIKSKSSNRSLEWFYYIFQRTQFKNENYSMDLLVELFWKKKRFIFRIALIRILDPVCPRILDPITEKMSPRIAVNAFFKENLSISNRQDDFWSRLHLLKMIFFVFAENAVKIWLD